MKIQTVVTISNYLSIVHHASQVITLLTHNSTCSPSLYLWSDISAEQIAATMKKDTTLIFVSPKLNSQMKLKTEREYRLLVVVIFPTAIGIRRGSK
jgi:hypothetical protein